MREPSPTRKGPNTFAPQEIIKQYGADILRLWVASSDYSEDLRLGKEIIQTTVDSYRKLHAARARAAGIAL